MGLGLLGRGVGDTEFLAKSGAELVVTDLKTKKELKTSLDKLKKFKNIKYILGKHRLQDFKGRDIILKSAGVPFESIYIKEARKNKIPIEMSSSLLVRLSGAKIIGITGTRGKSTVTQMIYEILKKTKKQKVFLGGNVRGIANLPLLKKVKKGDFIVMELDSWQLQGFVDSKISPHIAVFINFLRDHMNYYKGSMTRYFKDKAGIYKYQKDGDYLIVGKDVARKIKSSTQNFLQKKINFYVPKIISKKKLKLKILGRHNMENATLANTVVKIVGVSSKTAKEVLENFKAVEGRLQYLKTIREIKIYNDNNATSPDATIVALKSLGSKKRNIVLIIGGTDKDLDVSELIREIPKYCKSVILLSGTGTEKMKNKKRKMQDNNKKLKIEETDNLKDAIKLAMKNAEKGDIMLFSPTFASFGMFKNEYDRNDKFVKIIKSLK